MTEGLSLYVVYCNPADFPGKYVVRRQIVGSDGIKKDAEPLCIADTLEAAHSSLPPGLYNLRRMPEDEPQILEVWV